MNGADPHLMYWRPCVAGHAGWMLGRSRLAPPSPRGRPGIVRRRPSSVRCRERRPGIVQVAVDQSAPGGASGQSQKSSHISLDNGLLMDAQDSGRYRGSATGGPRRCADGRSKWFDRQSRARVARAPRASLGHGTRQNVVSWKDDLGVEGRALKWYDSTGDSRPPSTHTIP